MEKEVTTPDVYPMTLHALGAACNQSTNRDPVMRLAGQEIEDALVSMRSRGVIRVVHSPSNRATKYRHVIDEALGLDAAERAVVCVLLLRGAQTPGELRTRTDRLQPFDAVEEVERVLGGLANRDSPITSRLERLPGQKESRWIELLSDEPWIGGSPGPATWSGDAEPPVGLGSASVNERVVSLEARVYALEAQLAELRAALGD